MEWRKRDGRKGEYVRIPISDSFDCGAEFNNFKVSISNTHRLVSGAIPLYFDSHALCVTIYFPPCRACCVQIYSHFASLVRRTHVWHKCRLCWETTEFARTRLPKIHPKMVYSCNMYIRFTRVYISTEGNHTHSPRLSPEMSANSTHIHSHIQPKLVTCDDTVVRTFLANYLHTCRIGWTL